MIKGAKRTFVIFDELTQEATMFRRRNPRINVEGTCSSKVTPRMEARSENKEERREHKLEKMDRKILISGNRKWIFLSIAVIVVVGAIVFMVKF